MDLPGSGALPKYCTFSGPMRDSPECTPNGAVGLVYIHERPAFPPHPAKHFRKSFRECQPAGGTTRDTPHDARTLPANLPGVSLVGLPFPPTGPPPFQRQLLVLVAVAAPAGQLLVAELRGTNRDHRDPDRDDQQQRR